MITARRISITHTVSAIMGTPQSAVVMECVCVDGYTDDQCQQPVSVYGLTSFVPLTLHCQLWTLYTYPEGRTSVTFVDT